MRVAALDGVGRKDLIQKFFVPSRGGSSVLSVGDVKGGLDGVLVLGSSFRGVPCFFPGSLSRFESRWKPRSGMENF